MMTENQFAQMGVVFSRAQVREGMIKLILKEVLLSDQVCEHHSKKDHRLPACPICMVLINRNHVQERKSLLLERKSLLTDKAKLIDALCLIEILLQRGAVDLGSDKFKAIEIARQALEETE